MYEIHVSNSATDSREFDIIKKALIDRYYRLLPHEPGGSLSLQYKRNAPQRETVASAYTPIIMCHTHVVAGAFNSGLYASGFALIRPTLEALLKQFLVGAYAADDDGWKRIVAKRLRVTRKRLTELASRQGGLDMGPMWAGSRPG